MILVAFGSVPKDGGTFTFYRTLRPGLLAHGIDLRCVSVGASEAALWDDAFADEGCILLAESERSVKRQAQIFTQWCEMQSVDIVIAVNSIAILSALPHLPERIRVLARCANAFDHGYKITLSCYERIHRIIALAPKQIDDLTESYGADKGRITLIPNAANIEIFARAAAQLRGDHPELRLAHLGRIEHTQKGVLFLPDILQHLSDNNIPFTLRIAGKGVHKTLLSKKLSAFINAGKVEFVGSLCPDKIAGFFEQTDIYLFPSFFEGSPNALIEAMMAGCIPAAWNIEGIMDFLIKDGESGLLSPLGDCASMAEKISLLAKDRGQLQSMSKTISERARVKFSQQRLVNDYKALIDTVMAEPVKIWQPKNWSDFEIDSAFKQAIWRRIMPAFLKKTIRMLLIKLRYNG